MGYAYTTNRDTYIYIYIYFYLDLYSWTYTHGSNIIPKAIDARLFI